MDSSSRCPASVAAAGRRDGASRLNSVSGPARAVRGLKISSSVSRQAPPAAAERRENRPVARQLARQRQPRQRHHQQGSDAQHAVHEHGSHGIAAADAKPGDAVRTHRIAADTRQKAPEKGAEEEDAQDRSKRGTVRGFERVEQGDPAIGHQGAIDEHEHDGKHERPPVGVRRHGEHFARVALPKEIRGQAQGDGNARDADGRSVQGCGLGSVFTGRGASCFTWYARIRNFAYGTTCFIAPTFTWQGLRQVGQILLTISSR